MMAIGRPIPTDLLPSLQLLFPRRMTLEELEQYDQLPPVVSKVLEAVKSSDQFSTIECWMRMNYSEFLIVGTTAFGGEESINNIRILYPPELPLSRPVAAGEIRQMLANMLGRISIDAQAAVAKLALLSDDEVLTIDPTQFASFSLLEF